jgi:hypothetical protein
VLVEAVHEVYLSLREVTIAWPEEEHLYEWNEKNNVWNLQRVVPQFAHFLWYDWVSKCVVFCIFEGLVLFSEVKGRISIGETN